LGSLPSLSLMQNLGFEEGDEDENDYENKG